MEEKSPQIKADDDLFYKPVSAFLFFKKASLIEKLELQKGWLNSQIQQKELIIKKAADKKAHLSYLTNFQKELNENSILFVRIKKRLTQVLEKTKPQEPRPSVVKEEPASGV